jgi:hypothetical protein
LLVIPIQVEMCICALHTTIGNADVLYMTDAKLNDIWQTCIIIEKRSLMVLWRNGLVVKSAELLNQDICV